MRADQERHAEALAVWRIHGDRAPAHVAERIGSLALAGDLDGVRRWRDIAASMDAMMRATKQ